jgi:enoyl-CoA hydratase/carnithine racemase
MADELEDDPHEGDVFTRPRAVENQFVLRREAGGIVWIVLSRPPANFLHVEALRELTELLEGLEYERDVKLVVLEGHGKYFCAGFEVADYRGNRAYLLVEEFRRVVELLGRLDKPLLAVVAGPALGAGNLLAGMCDITLAAQSAKFGHPEARAGLFTPAAAALLPRLIGPRQAADLLLGGATLTAAEARDAGLVTRVVPDERLEAEATALIQRFQEGSAPLLQGMRRALAHGRDRPLAEAIDVADDICLNQLMSTDDYEEAIAAVLERRRPAWKNK